MTVERKKRYPIHFEVAYDDGEGFMTGAVLDLSETGCFIETTMPLKTGVKVRLTPLLPEQVGIFELDGEVARSNELDFDNHWDRTPGMGVRFLNPAPEVIAELRKLFSDHGGEEF